MGAISGRQKKGSPRTWVQAAGKKKRGFSAGRCRGNSQRIHGIVSHRNGPASLFGGASGSKTCGISGSLFGFLPPKRGEKAFYNAILSVCPAFMYRFHGIKKVGQSLEREHQAFRLEQSLTELFDLYDRLGGPGAAVIAAIEARVERSLYDPHRAKAQVREFLHVLLRAKDIHRFLLEVPDLTPLKLRLLECVLMLRTPEERWAAIRELLLASIGQICGIGGAGGTALFEAFKRQASLRGSTLGKLLQTVALFNFDLDGEAPPPNLRLRFARGAFPGHCWESWGEQGARGFAWEWNPANPLCRWEYLAADLGHALFRGHGGSGAGARGSAQILRDSGTVEPGGAATLFRAVAAKGSEAGGTEQMELFPLEKPTFMAELSRGLHAELGAEAPRLFALLLERLSWGGNGELLEASLADLAAEPTGAGSSAGAARERLKKLFAIVERLGQVRLVRIATEGTQTGAHTTTFLTLLGERTDLPQGSGTRALVVGSKRAGIASRGSVPPQAVRLVVDPCFFGVSQSVEGSGGNLGVPYRELPDGLLRAPTRLHPYAVGLFVFLRHTWQAEWETAGGVVLRSARGLLYDAGYSLRENARYRAIEALKRDLNFLQEEGWLGRWRLNRAAARDALDDVYRLESPRRGAQAEQGSSSAPAGAMVSA